MAKVKALFKTHFELAKEFPKNVQPYFITAYEKSVRIFKKAGMNTKEANRMTFDFLISKQGFFKILKGIQEQAKKK